MPYADPVRDEYFEWMFSLVGRRDTIYSEHASYRRLLMLLHDINFRYLLSNDSNRFNDGLDLRRRFAYYHPEIEDAESYLRGPCSVLEMMVALAVRCEETIMDDPRKGDRTGQWFWRMIVNLGLGSMSDLRFDEPFVEDTIERFLDRRYMADGEGGLFTVRDRDRDLRKVEIWTQMCWYLDSIS